MAGKNSSRLLVKLLCICVIAAILWKLQPQQAPAPSGPVSVATPTPTPEAATPGPITSVSPVSTPPIAPAERPVETHPVIAAGRPQPAGVSASELAKVYVELDAVQGAIGKYHTEFTINPVGTNAEITSALMGHNLKQVNIPVPDGSTINGKGEMCDRWGTPYFFHQLSHDHMQIRSAGPDRVMWTDDDIELQ